MRPYIVGVLMSVGLLSSCGTPVGPTARGQWTFLGLGGDTVYVLKAAAGELYAGTGNGIFKKEIGSPDTAWTAIGLQGRRVNALLLLNSQVLLASVQIKGTASDTSLYRTTDGGGNWRPSQNGFGVGGGSNQVDALAALSTQDILASGDGVVAKSTDSGQTWQELWGDWNNSAAFTLFLRTDPNWPNLVWSGGETMFFQPFLLKSRDGGGTWKEIPLNLAGDNANRSIAIDPSDSTQVFTGVDGQILESRDGGETWRTILTPSSHPMFSNLAVSSRDPRRVYAAGGVNAPEPQELVLYVSSDAGASWSTVVNDKVQYGRVWALTVLADSNGETAYVGTEQGVYAHRFE